MIGKAISHYRILEKLGEGGMGVVYKAQDTRLDRTVALKFLPEHLLCDEEAKTRFVQEAKAASALSHTNIATIYEIDEVEDRCFISMEHIEGKSIKQLLKGKALSVKEILGVAIQIAEGLNAAHKKDIVHRDIKSDNIMLTDDGVAKIMDFGLAKLKGVTKLTKTGTTLGTMQYMSPEQAQGMEVDQRSDIFSFGVILYEMITGQLPFKGEHEAAVIHSIVNQTPEPLARYKANVPEELQRIVDKALKKDLSTRYQSTADMVADLKGVQKETTAGVSIPSKKKTISRSIIFIGMAILIVIAAYTILSRFWAPSGTEPASVERKSIAVLPFKNMVPDAENEWFSDGITEDIIAQLSKIGDLKVISRTSIMLYKDSEKNLKEIGEELGVATILEGSVRRADSRVRIVSQLIDARTDEHIWAETYDREMKDIFDIQSDVAQKIAMALKAKLSPGEKKRIERRPTENLTAYDYYLKGREYYYRYHKQDNESAIELFKKAIEVDPDYALAYTGLGDAYGQRVDKFGFSATWLDSAIAVSKKALTIDPNSAEAYKALGLAYSTKGWHQKSLEANHKAVGLNPNYWMAVLNIGVANWLTGEFVEAFQWGKKAMVLNPRSAFPYFGIGAVYGSLGADDKAAQWYNKALELQPDFTLARRGLSWIYLAQGEYEQALKESRKILSAFANDYIGLQIAGDAELFSGNYAQAREYYDKALAFYPTAKHLSTKSRLAYIYWKTGQQDKAREMFHESLKIAQKELDEASERWEVRYQIAAINAIRVNKKESYLWLQKAIDAGWRDYRMGSIDPVFENLHDDAKFKQMMAEVKAMVDQMRKRVEEMEK